MVEYGGIPILAEGNSWTAPQAWAIGVSPAEVWRTPIEITQVSRRKLAGAGAAAATAALVSEPAAGVQVNQLGIGLCRHCTD